MKIIICLFLLVSYSVSLVGQSVSAMSYNIRYNTANDGDNWWELRKSEVVKLINYYDPDFLGIQEGLDAQVKYIADHTPQYKYIGVGRDDGEAKGEYTALYYDSKKYNLIAHNTFWLTDTPTQISVGWDASMERICTYGHFTDKLSNESFYVFNAHFDHIGPLARENSAKLIVKTIEELNIQNENIIVMGDFNCLPNSKPITAFNALLDDAAELSSDGIYGPKGTFNHFDPVYNPDRRIDYIFTKNLKVHSYRHIDDRRTNNLWPSDHLPVIVIMEN